MKLIIQNKREAFKKEKETKRDKTAELFAWRVCCVCCVVTIEKKKCEKVMQKRKER